MSEMSFVFPEGYTKRQTHRSFWHHGLYNTLCSPSVCWRRRRLFTSYHVLPPPHVCHVTLSISLSSCVYYIPCYTYFSVQINEFYAWSIVLSLNAQSFGFFFSSCSIYLSVIIFYLVFVKKIAFVNVCMILRDKL